jgi:hypothetical protein
MLVLGVGDRFIVAWQRAFVKSGEREISAVFCRILLTRKGGRIYEENGHIIEVLSPSL